MNTRHAHSMQQSSPIARWAAAAGPWASLAGGSALAALGLARRSTAGALLAAGGGFLIYRGARARFGGGQLRRGLRLQRSITIQKPREEVYRFCRDANNYARFVENIEVEELEAGGWLVRGPLNLRLEMEFTEQRENEYLAWRTRPGGRMEVAGSLRLAYAPGDRGTELHYQATVRVPGAALAARVLKLLGRDPGQQLGENLRRCKRLLETGEIATVAGQPSGRRSVPGAALQRIYGEQPSRQPEWRPAAMAR